MRIAPFAAGKIVCCARLLCSFAVLSDAPPDAHPSLLHRQRCTAAATWAGRGWQRAGSPRHWPMCARSLQLSCSRPLQRRTAWLPRRKKPRTEPSKLPRYNHSALPFNSGVLSLPSPGNCMLLDHRMPLQGATINFKLPVCPARAAAAIGLYVLLSAGACSGGGTGAGSGAGVRCAVAGAWAAAGAQPGVTDGLRALDAAQQPQHPPRRAPAPATGTCPAVEKTLPVGSE